MESQNETITKIPTMAISVIKNFSLSEVHSAMHAKNTMNANVSLIQGPLINAKKVVRASIMDHTTRSRNSLGIFFDVRTFFTTQVRRTL